MTEETQLIPYAPETLRGEKLLVLAPHPDDEVIGCGGLIALHCREKRPVRILVATDGVAASPSQEAEPYRERRETETRQGLQIVGGAEVRFLRFPDRQLGTAGHRLVEAIHGELTSFAPDLVLVPSPIELHPDHVALCRALVDLVQSDEKLHAELARTRIAFYEVSQPIRPNALVDITGVIQVKRDAISAHVSQAANRDYGALAEGLARFRALTLPEEVTYAEGFWVAPIGALRTTPLSALALEMSGASGLQVVEEPLPISVLIRTRNRPALLREAIDSVVATGYPAEIVVVNDGGEPVDLDHRVVLVQLPESVGRSEAMNTGARRASRNYLAFLDDDDLFYSEHLATLATATRRATHAGVYSDAISAFYQRGNDGRPELRDRLRIFSQDFDPELLLLDNYIPLPTLLVAREDFLALGGFDSAFDLFEDWDFLIRLSERGNLQHIPRVTCEIRQFEGGDSITQRAPSGSDAFRRAKLQVWTKHAARISNDTIANVLERHKQRMTKLYSDLVEALGSAAHAGTDLARLERDKSSLMAELQARQERLNEEIFRAAHLEGSLGESRELFARAHDLFARTMESSNHAAAEQGRRIAEQAQRIEELERAVHDLGSHNQALYQEINRLQSLLNTIYQSRSWKLHTIVERIRGRGE